MAEDYLKIDEEADRCWGPSCRFGNSVRVFFELGSVLGEYFSVNIECPEREDGLCGRADSFCKYNGVSHSKRKNEFFSDVSTGKLIPIDRREN